MIALIGIILLIGIVKKNAIIDDRLRPRGRAQRRRRSPEDAIYEAVPAALPADHDDDDGGALRRAAAGARPAASAPSSAVRSGISIVGGLVFSQMLTPTPHRLLIFTWNRCRLYFFPPAPSRSGSRSRQNQCRKRRCSCA